MLVDRITDAIYVHDDWRLIFEKQEKRKNCADGKRYNNKVLYIIMLLINGKFFILVFLFFIHSLHFHMFLFIFRELNLFEQYYIEIILFFFFVS